jgi:hypothetical protein
MRSDRMRGSGSEIEHSVCMKVGTMDEVVSALFEVLPSDLCVSGVQRNRHIPRYSFCAMCGNRERLHNFKTTPSSYGSITLFCRRTNCYQNYGQCLGVSSDLSNGVPFIWAKVVNTERHLKYFCRVPDRKRNAKGRLIDLTCMYCGIQSVNVVSHPRVPKKYEHTSFCKNKVCYSSFTYYVDNVAKHRVPYAMSTTDNNGGGGENSGNTKTTCSASASVVRNKKNNNKNKKQEKDGHSHLLTFQLPIVVERDSESVHKDVCLWCPMKDDSLKSFNDVLLGAFCDFMQIDENIVSLFKKVKCVAGK